MQHSSAKTNVELHIDDDAPLSCKVGGVEVEMIIDSSNKYNILCDKTWSRLKDRKVEIKYQIANPDKKFVVTTKP